MTLTWTPELEATVQTMLRHPGEFPWTLQGFGMLRCDLAGREYRLHVWDRRYRVDLVSDIHDHPWDLESLVMSGRITNFLYDIDPHGCRKRHWGVEMQPGPLTGNEDTEQPFRAELHERSRLDYRRTEVYSQEKTELHRTDFVTGTVTLVRRTDRQIEPDGSDRAHVYWHENEGNKRVTAAPRAATPEEIMDICTVALAMWGEDIGEASDAT